MKEKQFAILVDPATGFKVVKKEDDKDFLTFAQEQVGGYVESVPLQLFKRQGIHTRMLVDEDGRMKGLPLNLWASFLIDRAIVGPALIFDLDAEGHLFTEEDANEIIMVLMLKR